MHLTVRASIVLNSMMLWPNLISEHIHNPIKDWGRISGGLSEHLYAPEIVSRLNQPEVCLNSQVTMDIGSEAA